MVLILLCTKVFKRFNRVGIINISSHGVTGMEGMFLSRYLTSYQKKI